MLRKCLLFFCVFGFGLIVAKKLSEPRISCNGPVCIKMHGRSGKFSVSRGNETENATRTVTIEFDAIKEVDAQGNDVGKTGPKAGKHSFNTFAPLEFDFTDIVDTTYKGVRAKAFNFSAIIPGPNATLNVPIYFFSESGTVDLCDDEEIDIMRGIMKYNIEIYNWNFCEAGSGCTKGRTEEIGAYIDFVITIKNRGRAAKGKKNPKNPGRKRKAQKFFFGNSTSISFPSAIQSDGNCTEMPEEYPKLEAKGSKYSVIFRFPTFDEKIIYDPSVNIQDEEAGHFTNPTTSPPTTTTGVSNLLPSLRVVMILGVFMRFLY